MFLTVFTELDNSHNFPTLQINRRFYGKITGNQLPIHFPLFFTSAHNHFSGTRPGTAAKRHVLLLVILPLHPKKVVLSVVG